ncbi:MAG: D-alanyl-D-alanine carboxypeptidase family protein [Leptolyngbyaceae cyanobacterium RM1_1_2]|nr:D-alanyl-D-alanine carboxypeptidase family protein [Leptolyngbyaceae cyanobacterium RM1_1_2]
MDDIPEALREGSVSDRKPSSRRLWLGFWLALGVAIAVGLGALAAWQATSLSQSQTATNFSQAEINTETNTGAAASTPITSTPLSLSTTSTADQLPTVLGHRAYAEVSRDRLTNVVADGSIKLQAAATEKFLDMQAQARAEGVGLRPVSGFRTLEEQDYLFFQVKAERTQTATVRAEVSAPPGYSEHHTGYAIDIADSSRPNVDLEVAFENTPAFRWLQKNAARYDFELSFPRDNPQGISYEPWHWRFVGDRNSLETFYKEGAGPAPTAPTQ